MPRASDEGRRGNEGMNLLRRLGGAVVKVRGDDLLRRAQGVGVLGWTLLAVPAVVVALAVGNLVIGLLAVVIVLPLATVATWRTTGPRLAERVLWLGVTLLVGFFFAAAGRAFAAVMAPDAIFTNGDDLLFFAGGYALAAGARRRAVVLLARLLNRGQFSAAVARARARPIAAGGWVVVTLLVGVLFAAEGFVASIFFAIISPAIDYPIVLGTIICSAGGLILATAAVWPTTDAREARMVWWLVVPPAVVAALFGAFLLYYFGFDTLIVLWGNVAASCAAGALALAMTAVWVRARDTAPSLPYRLALLGTAALLGAFGLALSDPCLERACTDQAFAAYCAAGALAGGTVATSALRIASAGKQRRFQRNLVYLLAGQALLGIVIVLVGDDLSRRFESLAYLLSYLCYDLYYATGLGAT